MKNTLSLIVCLFSLFLAKSQTTILSDDFETGVGFWTASGDLTPNFWVADNCSGNGLTNAGTSALYITNGSAGCGATGNESHAYSNSPSGVLNAIIYHNVNTGCLGDLNLTFDYKNEAIDDIGELIYSVDNGATWITFGTTISGTAGWSTTTEALPVSLIGTSFLLGFRFTYNATDNSLATIAIDNILLTGLDSTNPTIICPPTQTMATTTDCDYDLINLSGLATGSDNCSVSTGLTYFQSPTPGTSIPLGTQSITITVEDEGTNSVSCSFDLVVEDQEVPTISICAANQSVIASSNCKGDIIDYTSLITATDNCTSSDILTLTQNPIAGTTINTTTLITITVEDEAGNNVDCQFSVLISDTINPTPICPADLNIAVNSSCQYTVPDITGTVTGTDNCSILGNMIATQSPAIGASATGVSPILITLIDEQGNLGTCITTINPIDNAAPTVTCPTVPAVDNGTNCDYTLPNYGALTLVLDNCPDFTISQTPAAGSIVNSGTTPITILVTDAGGNTETCLFDLTVFENVAPTITCPSNVSTCDPLVTYTDPIFMDNCASALTQIDGTGFSSGDEFPVGTTILQYEVADSSGNAQNCSFFIEIFDFPSSANITGDTIKVCDATSMILNAEVLTSGSGIWTVLSGQGNFNNEFSSTTGVNGLGTGENSFIWTVSSTNCGTIADTVVVIVNNAPIGTNIPVDTMYTCNMVTIDLITGTPINGTGLWYSNTGNIIGDPTSNLTTATITSNGWHQFIWSVSNDACGATTDTMLVYSSLADTIITSDTTVCNPSDITLEINAVVPSTEQSILWEDSGNNILFNTPFSNTTDASGFIFGNNIITYTISTPNCPDVTDTVLIISTLCDGDDYIFPTVITPNFDGKNDLFIINHLEKVYPEIHVAIFNRWGSVVYESFGYDEPWDGTQNGENLPMGTYFYKINLNDSEKTQYKGDISIIH